MSVPSSSPMPGISAKGAVDPQKAEVSMAGCVMISHPTVSPQAQARGQVLQAGMPVPAYEASLVSVLYFLNTIVTYIITIIKNALRLPTKLQLIYFYRYI